MNKFFKFFQLKTLFFFLVICGLCWYKQDSIEYFHKQLLWLQTQATPLQVNLSQKLLFFSSTNPQYDDRLIIELQVQDMKIPSSNLGRTFRVQKLFPTFRTIFVHNMFFQCSAKRRTSGKDLPVQQCFCTIFN